MLLNLAEMHCDIESFSLQLYVDAVDILAGVDSSDVNSFQPR